MLPKRQRLTAEEVRAVLKNGKSIRGRFISARYARGKDSKAAIVVSSKIERRAAHRNHLRRKGYGSLGSLPRGIHVVIFINKKEFDPEEISSICSKLS